MTDRELVEAAAPAAQPESMRSDDDDLVLVPRRLLASASFALDHKRHAPKTLESLRRYTTGDLSTAAAPAAQPMTDEQWLQLLLREADNETLRIAAIPGESIQTQGRWVLLNAGKKLKSLIERHYGITKKEQPC